MPGSPKVVLDTNVLISALLFGGVPEQILDLCTVGAIRLCASPVLISELREVLLTRFNWSAEDVNLALDPVFATAVIVEPKIVRKISRDADDDHVLACAAASGAEYIVTGDDDLLTLQAAGRSQIVKPRAFLERIAKG